MVVFFTISICLLVQLAYWLGLATGFQRARLAAGRSDRERQPAVSIVVASANEETSLPTLLAALSAQQYPDYEVIVVDDGSTDDTNRIIRQWASRDERIKLITTDPDRRGKKRALQRGIEAARYDILALTDADCTPGPQWLTEIVAHHADGDGPDRLVVGYSPFANERGILNRVSRYETFVTGFLTAAAIGLGRPYMAVGRNLSYTRRMFETIGGFDHSERSLSGDDDLLVQHVRRTGAAQPVHMFSRESFVRSAAPSTWREWLAQKRRHTSASRYYARDIQTHLLIFHVTGLALWAAPILAGLPGLVLLIVRLAVQLLALRTPMKVLGERDLLGLQPVWDLTYALYNLALAPLGVLSQPKKWR